MHLRRSNAHAATIGSGILALFMVLFGSTSALAGGGGQGKPPDFDPDDFVSEVTNQYFPLTPGTTWHYEGASEGVPSSNVVTVTGDTKKILGVKTTVVLDRAYEAGVLVEETRDWFAQDSAGNVWYFGEDSRDLDPAGNVISTEGSWQAGVDGAQPGVIMLTNPKVGQRYAQESAPGVAEDMAQVVDLDASICVAYGCFDNVLVTKEWTPLEVGTVELKYYAQGIGLIYVEMSKGGEEFSELASIT